MLPQQTVLIPLYATLRTLHLLDTKIGLIIVHGVYGMPAQILILRGFMTAIPSEIEKAARIEGATDFEVFWKVILPLSVPGIIVGYSLNFIAIWKEFVFGLVFLNHEAEFPGDGRHAEVEQRPLHFSVQPSGRRPRHLPDPDRDPFHPVLPQAHERKLCRRRQGLIDRQNRHASDTVKHMAKVSFMNVAKHYGSNVVIPDLNLEIADGEFAVLVGPSGCGKTTTLQMVAGLETISSGTLLIGDKDVTDVPPKDRDIAMVFQSYALFPHLDIRNNIAFGLKIRRMPKSEIDDQVKSVAERLRIEGFLDRLPKALSGGQRQRVALARALVRRPGVFLMDEPLSNLDANYESRHAVS